VSYPSFKNYLKTLRELLKRKHPGLATESLVLADVCSRYGKLAGLSEKDIKTLSLAALYKNLGAIHVSNEVVEQSFSHPNQTVAHFSGWLRESKELAVMSGLEEVATVLDQYQSRGIPSHKLARIFQVLNAWVACRHRRGWEHPMNDKEAFIELKQRANLAWSDPNVVSHFLHHLPLATQPHSPTDLPMPLVTQS
jgi:response regulator RpfG family c-di-GMP phosphodiesterase